LLRKKKKMRFEVLMAASMKMAVFCVVVPWAIALMMEAASTSETSVNFHQTKQRNNPEDSHLHCVHIVQRFCFETV
jgi:hypothetical protein